MYRVTDQKDGYYVVADTVTVLPTVSLDDRGVWVDGDSRGRYAPARLIAIAEHWGWKLPLDDEYHIQEDGHTLTECIDECDPEYIEDLAEEAFNHLQTVALRSPDLVVFVQDMGTVMLLDIETAVVEGWIEESEAE